jgi:hypothetical protein
VKFLLTGTCENGNILESEHNICPLTWLASNISDRLCGELVAIFSKQQTNIAISLTKENKE